MNTPARPLFLGLAIALFLTLTFAMVAQEQAPTAAEAPAASAAPLPPGELRRLDVPEPAVDNAAPAAPSIEAAAASEPEKLSAETPAPAPEPRRDRRSRGHGQNERVSFWHDSTLAEGEAADVVVSIFGSSTSAGTVREAVVSVFGSSTSSGRVGDAVVSVLGSSRVTGGRVGDAVVSVLGNTYVNARVDGEVVAVLGNVELGPDAEVHGELVCVGGRVIQDPGAQVFGRINNVAFGVNFGGFDWLHAWVRHCLVLGRPLAFGPHLMWAWWIALGFLALYVVLAAIVPRGVEKCSATLQERPGYSLLTALLITLLTPLAMVVLAVTVVGTPALMLALFAAGIFGKVVMLDWIGRRLAGIFGGGRAIAPALAVLVGGVVVLLLYTVPIVGFVLMKLLSWIGLGVVGYTLILAMQRPKMAAAAAANAAVAGNATMPEAVPGVVPPVVGAASMSATPGMVSPGFSGEGAVPVPPVSPPLPPPSAAAPLPPPPVVPRPVVSVATLPRAGFWIRIAASLLDMLIVALACSLIPNHWQPNFLLIFAAYCCVLWATKGTTVGGIICGLKVVRLDERPLDWPTALVRALGGFLSLVAAGIGFIWVAFDDQKQSWHDKIAGTTIVHVPKGVSLV